MRPNIVRITFLSIALAKAEFKLRHEGSYLGIFWYLLNPLLTFLLLFLVFSTRLGQNISSYPLYLLLGIIMFNLFQAATFDSTKILTDSRRIIRAVKLPLEVLVASLVIKYLFSHILEMIVFLIFLIFSQVSLFGVAFYLPLLLFFSLFIYGVCLMLSALSVYFTDLENVWLFASRLLWLATPIFYAIEKQSTLFFTMNLLNPLYYFITAARDIVIYTKMPELWITLGILFWTSLFLISGIIMFSKLKRKFAEII